MRKFNIVAKASALALAATLLVGCGERVEIPPGHVAKILTKDGYREGLVPSSKIRLDACTVNCDKAVILDATDKSYTETMEIFIPGDKLMVTVDVRATLSVDPNKADALFNKLPQQEKSAYESLIASDSIYNTYGRQILLAEVRGYLTQYSINEIASNIDKINGDLQVLLQKKMQAKTPFVVNYAGITSTKFPPIITKAQENAAERREAIAGEEAKLAVRTVELERELKEAQLQREIEKEKAETKAIEQRTLAEAVDNRVLRLQELEIEKIKAERWDGKLPQTIMGGQVPMIMDLRK